LQIRQSPFILNKKTQFTKISYVQQWQHLAKTSHYIKWFSAIVSTFNIFSKANE